MIKYNIKTRIRFGFIIVFLIMLFSAIFLLVQINTIKENTEEIADHPYVVSNTVKNIKLDLYKSLFLVREIRLAKNIKESDSIKTEISRCDERINNDFKLISSQYLGKLSDVAEVINEYSEWNAERQNFYNLLNFKKNDSVDSYIDHILNNGFEKIIVKLNVIRDFAQNKLNELVKLQTESADSSYRFSVFIILVSIILVLFFIWYISRSISRPIKKFVDEANALMQVKQGSGIRIDHDEQMLLYTLSELKSAFRKIELMNFALEERVTIRTIELKKSNDYLENLFYYATAPIIVWDTQFAITRFNPAFEKLTGLKVEEVLGKHIEIIFPSSQVEHSMDLIKKAQQGERWETVEIEILHINGTVSTLHWNSAHVFGDDEQTVVSTIAQGHDITEQKKVFNELTLSEDKFRYLFEYSNVGKSITLPTGEINVNKAFCDMLGYTKDELISQKWQAISNPADIEETQKHVNEIVSGKKDNARFIKRYIHKNGSVVWTDVSTAARHDENKKVLYFMTSVLDITAQKLSEEKIKTTYNAFISILDSYPGILKVIDPNTYEVIFANSNFSKLIPDFDKEKKCYNLFYNSETPCSFCSNNIILNNNKQQYNWEGRHPVTQKDYLFTDQLIKWPDGRDVRFEIGIDISDRKKAEDALIESNKELEQFAYIASHDLQEPLRMVSSYTQLLAKRYKDKLDNDAQEFIAYAVDGASRMQMLINDLLNYSRLNTRKKQMIVTDCNSILGKVRINLSVLVEENNAIITSSELPKIMVDETQFTQLLQNLISNGIKYHGSDSSHVHVSATEERKEWIFSVKDNGIGIDKAFHERIFGIFQRLHSREEYSGTGIGLAICKRIVDRHGGRIWLDSIVGKGTTFYFSIPKIITDRNN